MKKLFILAIALAAIYSCGKKNDVTPTSPYAVSNGYTMADGTRLVNDQRFSALSSLVTGNNFYTGNVSYYTEFYFSSVSKSNCSVKNGWWVFKNIVCTYDKPDIVTYGLVSVDTKRSELVSLLNKTVEIAQSGPQFYIRTTDNISYWFNANYPIQANPVNTYDHKTGISRTLFDIR